MHATSKKHLHLPRRNTDAPTRFIHLVAQLGHFLLIGLGPAITLPPKPVDHLTIDLEQTLALPISLPGVLDVAVACKGLEADLEDVVLRECSDFVLH